MSKRKLFLFFISFILLNNSLVESQVFNNSLSVSQYKQKNNKLPLLINTENLSILNSEYSTFGSKVQVKTINPINLPDLKLFIPTGSYLYGIVQKVQKVKPEKRVLDFSSDYQAAEIVFSRLVLPNGYSLNIQAFAVKFNPPQKKSFFSFYKKESQAENLWEKKILFLRERTFEKKRINELKNKFLEKKYEFTIGKGENIYLQLNSITY